MCSISKTCNLFKQFYNFCFVAVAYNLIDVGVNLDIILAFYPVIFF